MRSILFTIILYICALAAASGCSVTHPAYGKWEQYSAESATHFPDFDLYYIGTAPGSHLRFGSTMRWGIVYKFEARKGDERVSIAWSSGTGDIGPTSFTIGGRKYCLEMRMSDYLTGQAPEHSVAVWPVEEWERQRNPWWRFW